MISRFFIHRPIFATVLSLLITLAGGVFVFQLPITMYPRISPPIVSVTCNYPGASAKDVAEAVAAPIEQQVIGVENMAYMSSTCTNDGSYSLTVTFRQGTSLDMAQVRVQNRVALAIPSLPDVIKQTGVQVRKRSPDPLMGFALVSPSEDQDQLYLSNYTIRFVKDELLRLPGVADVNVLGQRDFSVRIWVNPYRVSARGLSADDLVRAIREQNNEVSLGSVGQEPLQGKQEFQLTVDTLGRLTDVEQFEQIVLKTMPDGRVVRLRDVARVEIGAKNVDVACRFDRMPTAFLVVFQTPDANALDTRDYCQAKMDELARDFPKGMSYDVSFDRTPYTRECISAVFDTLRDAVILVAVVVLLFLQNWRSALIPLLAVPVAVVGTFAVMAALGFSLNNLTLFGLVLAIGIVVDDAIVVVESVEHHIEEGLNPTEATIKAMTQVSGPVIAVGLVLSAVFLPCAFISGITGMFFRQFALTIAVSTLLSAINSLTLSPALCALMLKPRKKGERHPVPPLPRLAFPAALAWLAYAYFESTVAIVPALALGWFLGKPINLGLSWLFHQFNRGFGVLTGIYARIIGLFLRGGAIVLVVYGGLLVLTGWTFQITPRGFIPQQDMGYLLVNIQLPDSASMERSDEVLRKLETIVLNSPGVRHGTSIVGQSFALNAFGPNFGSMFVNLKPFEDRRTPNLSSEAIANHLRAEFAKEVPEATTAIFSPPPVFGVGRAGGFALVIEDRGDLGPQKLQEEVENIVRKGNQVEGTTALFSVYRANVPQLHIEPNTAQCQIRGVDPRDFSEMLRIYQGSLYVNDFNLYDRTWQVIVQADSQYRRFPEQLNRLSVRGNHGQMVRLGSLAEIKEINGPLVLTRYNTYPSATVNGQAAKGFSSREAIDLMQKLADSELSQSMSTEWTDMSYIELAAGSTAFRLFLLGVALVFLVLAAQYESWALPLAVILVVPMCVFSALVGVNIAHMDLNIFTQIGFVVLVGLAGKNAVLIVEFARALRMSGIDRREATLTACRLRLRPIVMTSLAFILGVAPLMLSMGAGSEMRRALGTAVFSGMVGVTLFGILLTPVFFFAIDWLSEHRLLTGHRLRRVSDTVLWAISLSPLRRAISQRFSDEKKG